MRIPRDIETFYVRFEKSFPAGINGSLMKPINGMCYLVFCVGTHLELSVDAQVGFEVGG